MAITGVMTGSALRWGARLVLGWLVLVGAVTGAGAQQMVEQREVREYTAPLQPGQRLVIRHRLGGIRVRVVEKPEVSVRAEARIQGVTQQVIQAYLRALKVSVQALEDRVEVETKRPQEDAKLLNQTTVDLEVTLPAGVPVTLTNEFGDLDVQGVGALQAKAPWGDMTVREVAGNVTLEGNRGKMTVTDVGGDVTVTHSFGDVEVSRVGGSLEVGNQWAQITVQGVGRRAVVENRGGPISLTNIGGGAEARCQGGQVKVSRVQGDLRVENSGEGVVIHNVQGITVVRNANGGVNVREITGDLKVDNRNGVVEIDTVVGRVTVAHANGPLRLSNVRGAAVLTNSHGAIEVNGVSGDCNVHNEFNPVTVSNVAGALEVFNAWGLVQAELPATAGADAPAWKLKTTHSNVALGIPPRAGCALSVEVISGSIQSQFASQEQRAGNTRSMQATINGGGRKVEVLVDLGMAQILKRSAPSPRPGTK